jgi:hypothetical protein
MPNPKHFEACFLCHQPFEFGSHNYQGRRITRVGYMMTCASCCENNRDGMAPIARGGNKTQGQRPDRLVHLTKISNLFASLPRQSCVADQLVRAADVRIEHQVCWMADSSQLPRGARMKVHNSVTSLRSPPSTMRPLARSTILSLSANFMATVA